MDEVHEADVADVGLDQQVWFVDLQSGRRYLRFDDAERVSQHVEDIRQSVPFHPCLQRVGKLDVELLRISLQPLEDLSGVEVRTLRSERALFFDRRISGAGILDAAVVQIHRDDALGAHCTADAHRHRIHQPAVDQQIVAPARRSKDARNRDARAYRLHKVAVADDDFFARHEVRGHGPEGERKLRQFDFADNLREERRELVPLDQPGARKGYFDEVAGDLLPVQPERDLGQAVEFPRRVHPSDQRADARPGDDVGSESGLFELAEDAQVRHAPRRPRAQCEPEARTFFGVL